MPTNYAVEHPRLCKKINELRAKLKEADEIIEKQGARIDELVEDNGRLKNALKEVVSEARRNAKRLPKGE